MTGLPFDIIIPSKGRPHGSSFGFLESEKLPYTIAVERSDYAIYAQALPNANFWVLPKANKGIGYSRAYILSKATRPFVMMDDDIINLYIRDATMHKVSLRKFLLTGWRYFSKHNHPLGMMGCKHGTFAIPKKETSITTIAHIVFMNPFILRENSIQYDDTLKAFEDIDILFQCIRQNVPFVRNNKLVYYTTPSGTATKGGIDYSDHLKSKYLNIMMKRYPKWIMQDKQRMTRSFDGQPLYHIDWKHILPTLEK